MVMDEKGEVHSRPRGEVETWGATHFFFIQVYNSLAAAGSPETKWRISVPYACIVNDPCKSIHSLVRERLEDRSAP